MKSLSQGEMDYCKNVQKDSANAKYTPKFRRFFRKQKAQESNNINTENQVKKIQQGDEIMVVLI
jgi:hypothetical protein